MAVKAQSIIERLEELSNNYFEESQNESLPKEYIRNLFCRKQGLDLAIHEIKDICYKNTNIKT